MGFYRDREPKHLQATGSTIRSVGKWASVVILSALVGSGATFAFSSFLNTQNNNNTGSFLPYGSTPNVAPVSENINVNVNSAITQVAKKMKPDVVAVVNYDSVQNPFSNQSTLQQSDIGSGVYFYQHQNTAYIVTNNHVVQGGAGVQIVLSNGKTVKAQVVGTDPYTDLAVLKVPSKVFAGVQPAQFVNSNHLQVGEPAVAIGTPGGLNFSETVTSGIISGLNRDMPVEEPNSQQILDYQPVIQTDAPINPGNSGGPLLNLQGQVMGINSSKIVAQGFQSMGFAIPSNEVQEIAFEIIRTGHAVHPALGITAMSLQSVPQPYWPNVPVDYGVYVQSVDTPYAQASGLKVGDVIVALNGHQITDAADLRTELFGMKPGDVVTLTVYDGSKKETLHVKLSELKSPNTTDTGGNNSQSNQNSNPFITPQVSGGNSSSLFN